MNPLQEYPHLFANGKFKIKTYTGHEYDLGNGVTLAALKNGVGRFTDVKLIARPIEDMTDEECERIISQENYDLDAKTFRRLSHDFNPKHVSIRTFLYLLSIGVYPFNQEDFGETVININEI